MATQNIAVEVFGSARERRQEQRMANGLGWLSLGLGLAEVAAPTRVARLIGVSADETNQEVLRAVGLRELVTGAALLSSLARETERDPSLARRPARVDSSVWARVGGDLMDLALLGAAFRSQPTNKQRLGRAAAVVACATLLDLFAGVAFGSQPRQSPLARAGIEIKRAITVNRSAAELYAFWRDLENLPRFMSHLESVRVTGDGRSHWKARAPAGSVVEWDAEIIVEEPERLIAWRSLAGADVEHSGRVSFCPAPGQRGTEIHVEMRYLPPAGSLGRAVAKLFGESPEQQLRDDLRAFKQVLETGDVVSSDSSIHRRPHPAQPPLLS